MHYTVLAVMMPDFNALSFAGWRGLQDPTALLVLVASLLAVVIALTSPLLRVSTRRAMRPPPGPPRLPFIGNIHQLPAEYQQHDFAQWGKKYGAFRRPGNTFAAASLQYGFC